jgi:phage baseplate assembly protein W
MVERMADTSFFGTDLALGFIANDSGGTVAGPFSFVDLQARFNTGVSPRALDLGVQSGMANLVQSLIARIMTERGELAPLGHPNYGSRHHQLVGEPNTESNRNLVKLYMIECIKQEPRITAILQIDVQQGPGLINRDKVDVNTALQVAGVSNPLNLVIPFSFAGPLS